MESYELGIRKFVKQNKVEQWHSIIAKPTDEKPNLLAKNENAQPQKKRHFFIHGRFWKIFISISILLNFFITLSAMAQNLSFFLYLVVFVHFTCFLFWIDFIAGLVYKISAQNHDDKLKARNASTLIIEGITLIPISLWYLLSTPHPNQFIFWSLRFITLLRFYRVQYYLSQLAIPGRHFWNVYFLFALLYLLVLMNIYCSIFIIWNKFEHPSIEIHGYGDSDLNNFVVALYLTLVTMLNIGFGDIVFDNPSRIWMSTVGMVIGFATVRGILTGVLATKLANLEKELTNYTQEYKAIMKSLKKIRIDKKVIRRVSDNMKTIWRYREGYLDPKPPLQLLPESIQKEIYFDINFGLLNRSVIFSMQPKSFLRSISMIMKNVSYLPGDVILEQFEIAHAMICIFSGVIEIVAGETEEVVLFSLTAGSIIGEASLFVSLPKHLTMKAGTYVEVQILLKEDFFRLALKYPEVCTSIRQDLNDRLQRTRNESVEKGISNIKELLDILKESKLILEQSKKMKLFLNKTRDKVSKSALLSLYVVSENIPRVKTTPINLLRGSPWILRPHTFLTETWNALNVLVILGVVFVYPYLVGFVRAISEETFMFLHLVEFIFIFDIYVQCTTAVKRKDHFTYVTDIKEIITLKLKSPGFYIDILSTLNFTAYADLTPIKNKDYAVLLLSQNKILRVWKIYAYFGKLENIWSSGLIFVRFLKYFIYFSIIVIWSGVSLYMEACPEEVCAPDRWFSKTEQIEIETGDPDPLTEWPALVSIYWSCVTVTGVGYGDIVVASVLDCLIICCCIIAGTFAFTYFMAEASATMKNSGSLRAHFQEELFSVFRFMREFNISLEMQKRVLTYFEIQWIYDEGYTFKDPQILRDVVSLTHKKILVADLLKKFLVVPFLRECDVEFLKMLVTLSKVRILPPDETVVEKGSISREIFILDSGFCVVSEIDKMRVEFTKIVNSVNAFGFVEMILGIPVQLNVRTLTHCKIITLDQHSFLRAITFFPTTKIKIDEKVNNLYVGKKLTSTQLLGVKPNVQEKSSERLWRQNVLLSRPIINVYRFHKTISTSYWEPFDAWGKLSFFKFFLMPLVLSPNSKVIKAWFIVRITRAFGYGIFAPPYLSLPHVHPAMHILLISLQFFGLLDLYLMFHVAYYDDDGLLIFHPAKTAVAYFQGNFALDLIIEFPTYTTIKLLVSADNSSYLLHAFGLFKVLQIYKYLQMFTYVEKDILRRSETVKILKYLPLALVVTNLVTGIIVIIECYSTEKVKWVSITAGKVLYEYQSSLNDHCGEAEPEEFEENTTASFFKTYLIGFYWVTASMTTSGFGDLSAHNRSAMCITIFIVVLGLFLYGYMFASLTSNMISSYTTVTKYRKHLLQMIKFLDTTNVNADLKTRLRLHYEYNWIRTEGSRPQRLLAKVHTSLRENLLSSMYEDTIKLVQSFGLAETSVLKIIGGFLQDAHFLCGETIVNYNDVLEYFYVIHRGIVEILDEKGQTIAIMGKGGIFGNINNHMFALSSVTVVSRKNLEILKMESDPFFKALEVVSNTTELLNFLKSLTTNFLKPINAEEDIVIMHRTDETALIDELPYNTLMAKNMPNEDHINILKFKFKKFGGIFKNSIFRSKYAGFNAVILPESLLFNFTETVVFFLSFLSGNLAGYIFFYQDFNVGILAVSYITDLFYFFKIPLSFALAYYDRYGEFVVIKEKIKIRYIKSIRFTLDLTSSIPLELLSLVLPETFKEPLFSFLHLNRLFRFYYVNEYFAIKSKSLMANKTLVQLWWVVICVFSLLHFTAGFWYFQACPFDYCQESCWVLERQLSTDDKWAIYSNSIYFIVALFTTTGFGDISIYTVSELLTAVIFMIFSQFCIVWLAGSMATVVYDQILNVILYERIVLELKSNFRRLGLNQYQMFKMWRYVSSLWLFKSKEIPKFIKTAPYALKCETMYVIFGNHLSQSYIFSSLEEAFLRQLAAAVERSLYFEGDYIVHQGDIDQTMYFICRGQVSVLTIHSNLMEVIHFMLQDNDQFGTAQGLLAGKPHHFSYRAEATVEILSLTYNKWKHLLKYFPHCKTEIYTRLQNLPHLQQTFVARETY